jgi:hypothetical protein
MPEPATVLRWEEPPPPKRRTGPRESGGHSRFASLAAELRANPGRWAVIYDGPKQHASGMATHIRMGHVICFSPCGDFDAVSRQHGDRGLVYARYVGDREAGDA